MTLSVTFYKDGGLTNCPKVTLPSSVPFDNEAGQQAIVEIYTDPYLYCDTLYYQVNKANWTVVDSITGTNYTSILSYGTETIYKYANITPSAVTKIQSGAILNVSVVFNTSLVGSTTPYLTTATS
jgi:hypothetical protein